MNRLKPNPLFLLSLGLILLLGLAACNPESTATPAARATALPPEVVIAEGHLLPKDDLYLRFAAPGKVSEILVEKGDSVKSGDVLARLADREQAQAALLAAQTEQLAAQQALDDFNRLADLSHAQAWRALLEAQIARAAAQTTWDALDLDKIDDRIEEAQAEVNDARAALDNAEEEFAKYEALSENNASRQRAKDELDEAQQTYNEAVQTLEKTQRERDLPRATLDETLAAETEARRVFENTHNGPDPDQLALLQSRLASAKAQVAAAERALTGYEITAPFDGTIVDLNITRNQQVGPETWAVLIADFSEWRIETSDLTELEVVKIFEGQQATISPDALPELQIPATVTEISQGFYIQGGDVSYRVHLRIAEVDPRLRWGMTVEITFAPAE